MITIELQGGLGNQLFQLAFLDHICKLNNTTPFLSKLVPSPHSTINYFDTIFKNWKSIQKYTLIHKTIYEPQQSWKLHLPLFLNIKIIGFFQHYKFISPTFPFKLSFPESCINAYCKYDVLNSVFIHIRGGDYLYPENKDYLFDTNTYYEKAIKEFPDNTKFLIFTNDKSYALTHSFLNTIQHEFVEENELDSLFIMTRCKGGICANSTLSWWGAYLNRSRKIILPSKWTSNTSIDTSGYYFPGSVII